MAHTAFAPATINEVLAQLDTFLATEMAWATTWDGTTLSVTPKAGDATFSFVEGTGDLFGTDTDMPVINYTLTTAARAVTGVANYLFAVSRAWFFAGATPEPWCLVVVETAPAHFVHLYFGFLERYGTWSGGAVIDAVYWSGQGRYTDEPDSVNNHMLFSGNSTWYPSTAPDGAMGAVDVSGAPDAAESIARFMGSSGAIPNAGGGFLDSYAWRLCVPGVQPHNGEAALVPITIFADLQRLGNWTPLGAVPGIRMVNIDDFDAAQLYTFAGAQWRIFPLASKNGAPWFFGDAPTSDSDYWFVGSTGSYGLAVLEA